ncbi:hypothetical protein [Nocardia sp. NRRL S-836]|uniref:hypothetical protein n=1 Tax=Nocardia sp. NRRL S-836 TaxID=1519492 RepID=UPI000B2CF793|nr:hypothetical protein [Nocardia sp. NRRL S-836]
MPAILANTVAVVPVLAVICLTVVALAVLILGAYIVRVTGKTEGLKHLAEIVKALLGRGRR